MCSTDKIVCWVPSRSVILKQQRHLSMSTGSITFSYTSVVYLDPDPGGLFGQLDPDPEKNPDPDPYKRAS